MLYSRFRKTARSRLSVAVLALAVSATQLDAQGLAGVDVFGTMDYGYLPCATLACSGTYGNWASYSNGGAGFAGASGIAVGGPNQNLSASSWGAFANNSYLPILRAWAQGQEEVGTHPNYSSNCCYISYGSATARGVQYFSYLGTSPQTYDITFFVSGSISAGVYGGIAGQLAITDGIPDAFGELPYGTLKAIDNISFSGNGVWSGNRTVSFLMNPGDSFYVIGSLFADVQPFGNGYSDATHTFTANFTAGDVNMLAPTIRTTYDPTVVPEPSTILLMATGLFSIVAVRRKKFI